MEEMKIVLAVLAGVVAGVGIAVVLYFVFGGGGEETGDR